MAYERTIWKNREVEKPRTFTMEDNTDGTITLMPSEGTIIEPGTPIIAANMNNIEDGIEEALSRANAAFQSASEGKQQIATAITGKGVPATGSDTFPLLASKIGQIETDKTGDATAVAGDILLSKTAYAKGAKLTGTMPNRGAVTNTITTQNGQYTIPAGYHNGSGKVTASFSNLLAGNIGSGINIGGVIGTLKRSKYGSITATTSNDGDCEFTVSGIGFRPTHIIWQVQYSSGGYYYDIFGSTLTRTITQCFANYDSDRYGMFGYINIMPTIGSSSFSSDFTFYWANYSAAKTNISHKTVTINYMVIE